MKIIFKKQFTYQKMIIIDSTLLINALIKLTKNNDYQIKII